jgi:type II secretory pathway pseudopilin PulG
MCNKNCINQMKQDFPEKASHQRGDANQGGWALLGLILALSIMSIVMVSAIQPNYQLSNQREKEAELFYRGQQMAEGIARWYNNGNLGNVNLSFPPAYGYLKELKKLKEGVTINLKEVKFVRPSATHDPFDGEDWEPVYARDPRIMPFLQAWAAETGGIIPQQLMLIAGTPIRDKKTTNTTSGSSTPSGSAGGQSGSSSTTGGSSSQGGIAGAPQGARPNTPADELDDDDDDDDDDLNDPLGHLFSGNSGKSGLPIVGVAPRRKGQAIRPLYGLQNYEEWVFIYIAPFTNRTTQPNQTQNPNQNQPLRRAQ